MARILWNGNSKSETEKINQPIPWHAKILISEISLHYHLYDWNHKQMGDPEKGRDTKYTQCGG